MMLFLSPHYALEHDLIGPDSFPSAGTLLVSDAVTILHHTPLQDPFGPDASPSAGMLVMWLTVRFLVILIPMYAVLRVMHTMRDQQVQQDADRQLDQEMMTLLWVSFSLPLSLCKAPCSSIFLGQEMVALPRICSALRLSQRNPCIFLRGRRWWPC